MQLASAHLSRPKAGETACGDAALVRGLGPARSLVALVDALGHGPAAAEAAGLALATLGACDPAAGVGAIVARLDAALRGSRGAAAFVGVIDGPALSACIVGNVELRASREGAVGVVHSPGILGAGVRKARVFDGRLLPGDRLLAFSDGLSPALRPADLAGLAPAAACARALERFGSGDDDASVLVLDLGPPHPAAAAP